MMNIILHIFTLNIQEVRLYLILKETYLKETLPQKQPPNSYVNGLIFMYPRLEEDWKLARESQELKKIKPLT